MSVKTAGWLAAGFSSGSATRQQSTFGIRLALWLLQKPAPAPAHSITNPKGDKAAAATTLEAPTSELQVSDGVRAIVIRLLQLRRPIDYR